jgi:hypothetical protein
MANPPPSFFLLKQQADVSAARGLILKMKKAFYVFNRLKEAAHTVKKV